MAPDMHEGESHTRNAPLHADDVAAVLVRELGSNHAAEVHVSPGGWQGAVLALVRACDPDLLVLSPRRSVRRRLTGYRVSALVDRVTCPVVCLGPRATVPSVLPRRTSSPDARPHAGP